jgi:hypothetical protein
MRIPRRRFVSEPHTACAVLNIASSTGRVRNKQAISRLITKSSVKDHPMICDSLISVINLSIACLLQALCTGLPAVQAAYRVA